MTDTDPELAAKKEASEPSRLERRTMSQKSSVFEQTRRNVSNPNLAHHKYDACHLLERFVYVDRTFITYPTLPPTFINQSTDG
jgi:hypothetical protein